MQASEVLAALLARHEPPRWASFPEMRCGTLKTDRGIDSQRIDLWCMDMWPSSHERLAYEVKVSRADYVHELRNPDKRRRAMLLSNRYLFAAPAGLIARTEVPIDCGLVEVWDNGRCEETVPAPVRDIPPVTVRFVAELARRAIAPEQVRAAEVRARVRNLEEQERRLLAANKLHREAMATSNTAAAAAARALSHVTER